MAGSRTITTDDVKVIVTTASKKLHIESQGAVAVQTIGLDPNASGALATVNPGDVMITFTEIAPDFPPTAHKVPVEFESTIGCGREAFSDIWSFTLPNFPMNPAETILTFNLPAQRGGSLVVDTLSDGSLLGDIDVSASSIDWQTGKVTFKLTENLANREPVKLRIRYPEKKKPEVVFNLNGNVYDGQRSFIFQLGNNSDVPAWGKPDSSGIARGTVRIIAFDIEGIAMRVIDDGQGHLVGDVDSTIVEGDVMVPNVINYSTGAGYVTFARPVKDQDRVKSRYGILCDVQVYKDTLKREKVTVALRFDDLQRIVKSAELTMDSEQAAMQFNV